MPTKNESSQIRIAKQLEQATLALLVSRETETSEKIIKLIQGVDAGLVKDVGPSLAAIFAGMDDSARDYVAFIRAAMGNQYYTQASAVMRNAAKRQLDSKTIEQMTRYVARSYLLAIQGSQDALETYFKVATKQQVLTEAVVVEAMARGLIDGQDLRESRRLLRESFRQHPQKVLDQASLNRYKSRVLKRTATEVAKNENLTDALRKAVLAKKRKSLEEGRYIQIINKNGQAMTFTESYYASMVTRTNVADAQVAGTIEGGKTIGVQTFKISSHNTTTEICKRHENQVYTTATSGPLSKLFDRLTPENTPTFHVKCKHRLTAHPLTEREIEAIRRTA